MDGKISPMRRFAPEDLLQISGGTYDERFSLYTVE